MKQRRERRKQREEGKEGSRRQTHHTVTCLRGLAPCAFQHPRLNMACFSHMHNLCFKKRWELRGETYPICLSMLHLFQLIWQSLISCIFLQLTSFCSSLWLTSTLLLICTISSLSFISWWLSRVAPYREDCKSPEIGMGVQLSGECWPGERTVQFSHIMLTCAMWVITFTYIYMQKK